MNETVARVAVFISGGGSNLQSLMDAAADNRLAAEISLVVSSRRKAHGLVRAREAGIDTFVFKPKRYKSPQEAGADLLDRIKSARIDFIALAGFMSLIPPELVAAYRNRIVNIHPALLPEYGGKGMYGHHVHEAVLAAGETKSGATVHLVDEIYDNGQILEQQTVPVHPDDTPETLAARVLEQEHQLYPKVLDKLIKGEYTLKP